MADRQELEISISETGEVSVSVSGVAGSGCLDLTRELEEELGSVVMREKKSEFYMQPLKGEKKILNSESGEG